MGDLLVAAIQLSIAHYGKISYNFIFVRFAPK